MPVSISLKLDEKIFDDSNQIIKSLATSRNKYINDALSYYNKIQKRRSIQEQLKKELTLIEASSMEVLKEMEALQDDYEAI